MHARPLAIGLTHLATSITLGACSPSGNANQSPIEIPTAFHGSWVSNRLYCVDSFPNPYLRLERSAAFWGPDPVLRNFRKSGISMFRGISPTSFDATFSNDSDVPNGIAKSKAVTHFSIGDGRDVLQLSSHHGKISLYRCPVKGDRASLNVPSR
jgi:hypothetical protein